LCRYLDCGILAYGFARARCAACGHDFLIAYSCKCRGVCPSCTTRRMVETAAHLVYESVKPGPGGSVGLMPTPLQLQGRLAALIPPRRKHRHRYFGVLAPKAPLREAVIALAQPVEIAAAPTPVAPILPEAGPDRANASPSGALRLGASAGAHLRGATAYVPAVRRRDAHHRFHHRDGGDPGDSRSSA